MAEAAGLALTAAIVNLLNLNQITFLTDNQIMVNFFNGNSFDTPPQWEIRPFTQRFLNEVTSRSVRVLKIDRILNTTAHVLASQALRQIRCRSGQFFCLLFKCESFGQLYFV